MAEEQQTETQEEQTIEVPQEYADARPEWLPEKFNSPEDLAKGYSELEKQFTQSRQAEAEANQAESSQEVPSGQAEAKEAVENAGLDFEAMQAEFAESGELSENTYKDLEAKGIPKEMVDAYVDGQMAKADAYSNELYGYAGGEEAYQEMSAWASENLSDSEIDAFNDAITSGNESQARLAIDGMASRYRVTVAQNLRL